MIKIVTDSTAYLPESLIQEHHIRIVPLYVHFGNEAFKEGQEMTNAEFYARLKTAPQLPTTSQPSAGDFLEVFKDLSSAGHEILTLTISSQLSGTWDSAMAAKNMLPEAQIEVVDSLSTSMGLLLIVKAAADAVAEGASLHEIASLCEEIKEKLHVLFVVDTLEYLAKGGRIGGAKAFLGTILKVKPILFLQQGRIEPLEQVRSKSKAQARLLDLIAERLGDKGAEAQTAVTHAMAPEDGARLKQEVVERLGCSEPLVAEIGPVIGTHTGPGTVGIAAYV